MKNPTNWPLIGMLPALLMNLGPQYYDWMTSILIENGGTFQFIGPWLWLVGGSRRQDSLVTADPRNIEHVLRYNFANYPKGPDFTAIFHDLLGDGIFNADHDLWRLQRKTASLHLNSRSCRDFADATIFSAASRKLLPILRHNSGSSSTVDFQDLMLRFTFDTISIVAFGIDTRCLSPDLPKVPFAAAFETALECTSFRFSTPMMSWKVLRCLGIGWEKNLSNALHEIDAYVQEVVDDRRKAFTSNPDMASDLLTCFLRMEEGNGGTLKAHDDKFLKDVIINILLAGRDTSALALAWFFWLLASHPKVEEKLVQEARHVLLPTNGELPAEHEILHTREKLNQMVYLQAALLESLRLYPSVPTDYKYVMSDDVLPDGNQVRKGQQFIYSIYSMGRMESIWGKDCLLFKPERWLVYNSENSYRLASNVSPFQYTAFNAGPRTCLGKDMAFTLMKVVVSTILLRYSVVCLPGQEKIVPKLCPTLYIKDGLQVRVQPRQPL